MSASDPSDPSVEAAAAQWLARRDRGLTPAEQDAYLQWLRDQPAHGAEITRLERGWKRLDALRHWQPAHSAKPNPDLLAPPSRRRWLWPSALAAAAALVLAAVSWWSPPSPEPARRGTFVHPGPERLALADGSLVELKAGAKVDVDFTPARRNVRLVRGEAHFTVAHDAARPFVVAAGSVGVRAVGTAFAVQLSPTAVSVLVTEGRVQLDELQTPGVTLPGGRELSRLAAGQEAVVRVAENGRLDARVQVRDVSADEIARLLTWQTMRLEFFDLPLREVVAEFNRYNTRKLLIEDRETGEIIVGGSFRADNVESFVRLLDLGFGISASPRGDDLVLQRRR